MRNLFVINGFIPAIVARALMEGLYRKDENYLVLDMAHSLIRRENVRDAGSELGLLLELFLEGVPARAMVKVSYNRSYETLARRPFQYLRELRRLVTATRTATRDFPQRFDRLIYSGNARVHTVMRGRANTAIAIEHGLGDYIIPLAGATNSLRARLKNILVQTFTGACERAPDERLLMDGGQCRAVSSQAAHVRRVPTPDVRHMANLFRERLRERMPDLYAALADISERMEKGGATFVALPPELLKDDEFRDYLRQLKTRLDEYGFDLSRSTFLVKPHPTDFRDYTSLYGALGGQTVMLAHPLSRLIPAEFYFAWLNGATPVGQGSSSLFYGRWWLDRPPIYFRGSMGRADPVLAQVDRAFADDIESFEFEPVLVGRGAA